MLSTRGFHLFWLEPAAPPPCSSLLIHTFSWIKTTIKLKLVKVWQKLSFIWITTMDLITRTPGLVHIAEQIFSNLERNDLLQCQEVNEYWGSILRNPWFWYNRMMKNSTLSQEHRKEWRDFCEKLSKSNLTKFNLWRTWTISEP